MITAIDSNVLLDLLRPNEEFLETSIRAIEVQNRAGSLVVCDYVYAEICCHFQTQEDCDYFLQSNQIRLESLNTEALFLASRVWRAYRQHGGSRSRILGDFLIGAHALLQATQLMTRDRGFYRTHFSSLQLIDPSRTGSKKN